MIMRTNLRTYSELKKLKTFEERFEYAKIGGIVGEETFGSKRYINQTLYQSSEWKSIRRNVMLRDYCRDLGVEGFDIFGGVYIHHLNPITIDDIIERREWVFGLNYLISTSLATHNALHYGDISLLSIKPIERMPNDTCPWKIGG